MTNSRTNDRRLRDHVVSGRCSRVRAGILCIAGLLLGMPAQTFGQATSPTAVSVSGGSQGASQTVPTGTARFGLRVPLRPNAENILALTATDADGRTVRVDDLRIAQISLTEIVRARVTAQRLTTPEVRQLVSEGVINLADPTNYNVSRFVVALVVGGREVQVPVPVVRQITEPFGVGEAISIGCAAPGQPLATSDRAISVPCGDGGGAASSTPTIQIIPFEVASPVEGMPSIPGVILIEGRIKTLKEFFKVNLLLMNVSSLFTLSDLTARLEVPEGMLTSVAPAGGAISLPDIAPGGEATGQFIVRGDTRGVHAVKAHFGGTISGSFLPERVPFSGSASTDLEVKGPPELDVKVTHPDHVTAGEPYDLTITVHNTDDVLDALYTSMAIDVGGGAELIDEATGEELTGPIVRTMGDILRGETVVQTYRVMPHITGPITSCVGAADANIRLSVEFVGHGPGCAIGTLPSERLSPDGHPTVTVLPSHNTVDVSVDPPIVALFSDRMIEATITTGYPSAAFNVLGPDDRIVPGTLQFTELFEATAAIFRPSAPLAFGTLYTIVVNPSVFNLDGLALASGIVARFTTTGAPAAPDTIAPAVTVALEPPLTANAVGRGQTAAIVVEPTDATGVTRVDLLLDGALIDAKPASGSLRFLVDTASLLAGTGHALEARAFDLAGNVGTATLAIQIAPDQAMPTASIVTDAAVRRGALLPVTVEADDDGRVASVALFLDVATTPVATGMVEPFQFAVQTIALAPGPHQLRALVVDGAGNATEATMSFQVTTDTTAPQINVVSPQGNRFRLGQPIAFVATASDDTAVEAIAYRLDAEANPRAIGAGGFTLVTDGLAPGVHSVAVVAADTSGNAATLAIAFELIDVQSDTVPPPPASAALITLGPPTGGLVTITGLAGAVEPLARVSVTNLASQAGATAAATAAGSFTTMIEAAGGHTLSVVVIDEAGNTSMAAAIVVPVPATLTSIAVMPATIALSRSQTSQQLTVTGVFSDASQRILATGVTFASSAPTIASATGSGLVLPGQNGQAVVTVSAEGAPPVTVPVSVDFTSIIGITAEPSPLMLAGPGQSQRLTVAAQFSDNTTGAFTGTPRFATANPSVAIVDSTGRVTSTGVGSTTVTVAASALPPVAVLVVVEAVQPSELLVTPTSAAFTALGESQILTARFRYSDGTIGAGPFAVTFQSLDTAVATVTESGEIVAAGEGSTSIVVQSLSFSVSVTVSVVLPSTLPAPEIVSIGRPIAGHGDTLAILGRNFAGVPEQNAVTVNGERAEVVGASFERLIALVPHGATSGPVQVRVGGQLSNTTDLAIYPRRARAVLSSLPFDATPGAGQTANLGTASFHLHPGDDVVVAGDPNTIAGASWSGLIAPVVGGTLVLTVNGTDHIIESQPQPINVSSLMPPVSEPTVVTMSARIEANGALLSSRGVAIVAGPQGTGAFAGERFLTGDTIGEDITIRFRTNAPDGTMFAATAQAWYRLDGGYPNGAAGGAIVGGASTPNDSGFRTFTAIGGEVTVPCAAVGVFSDFGSTHTAIVALVPADAGGNRVGTTPVAEARILLGALDSASILPQQVSAVADGVDRPILVDVNSVRDNYGNRIMSGTRIAVTSAVWYRRSDGGYPNGSAGGVLTGGVPTPNDGSFRTSELVNGSAQFTYSSGGLLFGSGVTGTAILGATVANAANSRVNTRPFAEGSVVLSSPGAATGTIVALPTTLSATSADSRSVITLSNLTDAAGRPVPDGVRIAVTAAVWYRESDGGYPNASWGGTIVGGDPVPNNPSFRSFVVTGGQASFTYSNANLVLNRGETATTVIAILPAQGNGNVIGTRPFAEVRITQAGLTSATIVATPSSTLADGARRPIAVSISNIRDALGNVVPDGTRIALTAQPWYRAADGGYPNGSAGGLMLDGVPTPNDGSFRTFTVANGRIDATFSAENIAPLGPTASASSIIAAVVASSANDSRLVTRPFAEGVVAVSSVATSTPVVTPTSLLADRQARTAVVTLTGLTDAQGRQVPDGTRVAITAAAWYRVSDGVYPNGSAGGTMIGGDATPNDGNFRTYSVANGQVSATYSASGLFVDPGATAPAILSVLPAMPNGDRIGSLPFAAATVTLTGIDTGTFVAPATTSPGSAVSVTLANLRDAAGQLVPDGARVAVTAAVWYNRDGSFPNGSAGGSVTGGVPTPNDGNFQTFVVSGGQVSFTFNAPTTSNATSVISVISADGSDNRNAVRPFAAVSIHVQ